MVGRSEYEWNRIGRKEDGFIYMEQLGWFGIGIPAWEESGGLITNLLSLDFPIEMYVPDWKMFPWRFRTGDNRILNWTYSCCSTCKTTPSSCVGRVTDPAQGYTTSVSLRCKPHKRSMVLQFYLSESNPISSCCFRPENKAQSPTGHV